MLAGVSFVCFRAFVVLRLNGTSPALTPSPLVQSRRFAGTRCFLGRFVLVAMGSLLAHSLHKRPTTRKRGHNAPREHSSAALGPSHQDFSLAAAASGWTHEALLLHALDELGGAVVAHAELPLYG